MSYKISKFLNDFLDEYDTSITEMSEKMGVTHPYISYIKNGTKTASKKFILNLVSAYPTLKKKENELLLMLESDKKIEKLKNIEKKRREIIGENKELSNFSKMTKKDKMQLEDVLNSANMYFNDENVSEEDKKKLHDSLSELFFDAKLKNKRK